MSLFRGEGEGSIARSEVLQFPLANLTAATYVFVADRAYNLVAVREIHQTAGGAASAIRPRKIQVDGQLPSAAAGANVIELTAAIPLTGTVNTVQNVPVVISQIAAGDRIAFGTPGGTIGTPAGSIQLELQAA